MVIASWNVNSVKARLEAVLGWLGERRPDVLLLQELKGVEFPALEFQAAGYQSASVVQKSYNGVGVLVRGGLSFEVVSTTLAGDDEDSHARWLECRVAGMRVVNLYLPNGNPVGTEKFDYKMRWMERLQRQMAAWVGDGVPTVMGGDWNVIPEDIDCHKPASWAKDALFQPETRMRYRGLLALGYTDAFRLLHPEALGAFTFWDYFRDAFAVNRGVRIDHLLVSPELVGRVVRCEVDRGPRAGARPSDHTPVWVELAE
jgi:exodeoxyribonuclease-3